MVRHFHYDCTSHFLEAKKRNIQLGKEDRTGAAITPLIIALVLLILLAVYISLIFYHAFVYRF
ncbi:hypothetical protein ACFC4I_01940 [Enterococcus durans]|uniref:hypothetical protein n=1 Tax=Enterococcus durans TaxID=53345 RepID=UPI0035E2199B